MKRSACMAIVSFSQSELQCVICTGVSFVYVCILLGKLLKNAKKLNV